ncbi:alpha/beta fold hydrolase [Dactylosporangium sp. CA-139066]|uniref:alpha/beta fold hydrolase n=1 Tax=Dactylosporangium sp. CA-139066 TaxID=3239930 RepID=UPI003D8EED7D
MFEGFQRGTADVGDVEINYVSGGSGPAVILLHGYPQTLTQWAKLAPLLADDFTVVCADLRGYGDSSKPRDAADHSTYSFRAMAADQVALMDHLGHDRFHVAGHDRGGRVAHRLTLDRPDRVASLSVLDIVPTYAMYMETNRELAARYWQWYFLPLPAPFPERLIGGDPDYYFENCLVSNGGSGLEQYDAEMVAEYRRCWNNPEMIHASCSDYRAGASIDLEHDREDLHLSVDCPTLALWAGEGLVRKHFDVGQEWRRRCSNVRSESVPGGHFFPELQPGETARIMRSFLGA